MRFGTLDFDRKRRSWIALFAAALLLASLGSALAQTMERLRKSVIWALALHSSCALFSRIV
jgi:hypothetical protein